MRGERWLRASIDFADGVELPGAVESAHMGNPDFRVGGRIFATLSDRRAGAAC